MNRYFRVVVFLFFICFQLYAQERPPIKVFHPEEYGAEYQNWGISQSNQKNIYIANNNGLLEFNGASWRLYISPNESIIRSVRVINDLIYTGCYREFGYWKKNEFGALKYTSLSQALNISFLDDEEIWNIIDEDEWILFQSLKRIYIYNKEENTFSIINSDTTIYKIFKVNESVYYQKTKGGIYQIVNGKSVLLTDDPIVKENLLVNMFYNNGELLIQTEGNGFYTFNNQSIAKWQVPCNDALAEVSVYRSIQLKDGSYLLGTISDGIFRVSASGDIDYQINSNNGLSNNTILSIFEDADNNIWLGLNNGINCINVNAPFRIYNQERGKIGTVYSAAIFKGNLYLGTNQGLFYKPWKSHDDFKFIEGTQGQVWSLIEHDGMLFCGHNSGTFIVNNKNIQRVSGVEGTWNIIPVEDNKDILLQGNYDGLYVLENRDNQWQLRNKIEGFDISSRFFEMIDSDEILISHEYKGVYKLNVNAQLTQVEEVVKDTSVDKGITSSLIKYKDNIFYSYKKGVFKYDVALQSFTKDTLFSRLISPEMYSSGKLIYERKTNKLWSFSAKRLSYLAPGKFSSTPIINAISLSEALPRGLTGYENIQHLENQSFLIGTASGYIVLDLDKIRDTSYDVKINTIRSNNDSNSDNLKLFEKGVLENSDHNIDFAFNITEFDKYVDTEYQYILEGIDTHWSNWSKEPFAIYKYLPFGDYIFKVRARAGDTISNNEASYNFQIKRPWLLSNKMIVVYVIFLWLISLIVHNMYKRYYKKQREKLLYKTQRELELKELENQKQLMKFNNDKLRQDIENKNRELGISTMSLIKKNEFLNAIKKELVDADDARSINKVVKVIDKNINNTDDWNLFEEAFNNADKDFLKKIKTLHPALTSNDLRLCAYLRLNLSSKEIAPLLNISTRSVEVKRYRLRKKLGLSHESSLTDYILEI